MKKGVAKCSRLCINFYTNVYPYQLSCKMNRVNVIWLRTDKMRFYVRKTFDYIHLSLHERTLKSSRVSLKHGWWRLTAKAFEVSWSINKNTHDESKSLSAEEASSINHPFSSPWPLNNSIFTLHNQLCLNKWEKRKRNWITKHPISSLLHNIWIVFRWDLGHVGAAREKSTTGKPI